MECILMKDGRKIEVDDTPYVIKDGMLYVYAPNGNGWGYVGVGEVDKEISE